MSVFDHLQSTNRHVDLLLYLNTYRYYTFQIRQSNPELYEMFCTGFILIQNTYFRSYKYHIFLLKLMVILAVLQSLFIDPENDCGEGKFNISETFRRDIRQHIHI